MLRRSYLPVITSGIGFLDKFSKVEKVTLPGPHHHHMTHTDEVSSAIIDFLGLEESEREPAKPSFDFKGL